MRIILSPAKKMKVELESPYEITEPTYEEEAIRIAGILKSMAASELKKLWACNDKIVEENIERLEDFFSPQKRLSPAILSYEGIAFQYMAPTVFREDMLSYVKEHLRILSGLYGVLRAMDGVSPYRLEMQAKLKIGEAKDLYDFWGDKLYKEVKSEDGIIINLASKEYSKCIEKYLTEEDTMINCHFGEWKQDKFITKGTYAKMARGEMVRFMSENNIKRREELKNFNHLGYLFDKEKSTETEYYFYREERDREC